MNYRLVLHFCLQACLFLLALFVFGMFFWILDEWIGWDLLPVQFQSYIEALIFVAGSVVLVLLAGILLGYRGLFAHWLGRELIRNHGPTGTSPVVAWVGWAGAG